MATAQLTVRYERDKETPNCFRYSRVNGDHGVRTIYIEKDCLGSTVPEFVTATFDWKGK
jgi:hypothetical protein